MSNNRQFELLRKKWTRRHKKLKKNLWTKHKDALDWLNEKVPAKEQLATGAIGALMLTSTLPASTVLANIVQSTPSAKIEAKADKTGELVSFFMKNLPAGVRPLTADEEKIVSDTLSYDFGFNVLPELDGKRLNRSYGLIGAEQHLKRYPGDSVEQQLVGPDEQAMFEPSGMAPGLGAWGYFAQSKDVFNSAESEREKWYIAVPTFNAPGYLENVKEYHDWFKYRKMLVVNPKTGQAVVCDVADAGPADWTGKHLGGSPEVMHYLGLGGGPRKGAVLYFFIDNSEADKIPLGPVKPYGGNSR